MLAALFGTHTASADGIYFSEGIGGGVVKDELQAYTEGTFRIRVAAGWRAPRYALEAWIAPELTEQLEESIVTAGLDAKYLFPLNQHVELYVRGSASHMWIEESGLYDDRMDQSLNNYQGRGLGFGTGIQISGKVPAVGLLFWPLFFSNWGPKIHAGAFVEQGYDFYRLRRDPGDRVIDAQITRWTMGFAVGQSF